MIFNFPEKVTLIEVGPRDGFQFETRIIPTEMKAEIIHALIDAGIRHIQATSFVHPEKIPQMSDAEHLVRRLNGPYQHLVGKKVVLSALILNERGLERAADAGINSVEISMSASRTHSLKNSGMSLSEAEIQVKKMFRMAKKYEMKIRAGVQCAFGCAYEGNVSGQRVLKILESYLQAGADVLCLSDTTGMATPFSLNNLLEKVVPLAANTPVTLHLHDTRGLGLVNVFTALSYGICHFDTSLGGMGGCPFVPEAAGNIATEDTVYLLESLGIKTGIDKGKVSECTKKLESFLSKRFPGKIHKLNRISSQFKASEI